MFSLTNSASNFLILHFSHQFLIFLLLFSILPSVSQFERNIFADLGSFQIRTRFIALLRTEFRPCFSCGYSRRYMFLLQNCLYATSASYFMAGLWVHMVGYDCLYSRRRICGDLWWWELVFFFVRPICLGTWHVSRFLVG